MFFIIAVGHTTLEKYFQKKGVLSVKFDFQKLK